MTRRAANVEDYDESMLKCKKITRIVPALCESIRQIQTIDERFSLNFNLKLAEQLLDSLNTLEHPSNLEEDKKLYVNAYKEHLTTGLKNLDYFFDNMADLALLNDIQRRKMSSVSANIAANQDAIIKIISV